MKRIKTARLAGLAGLLAVAALAIAACDPEKTSGSQASLPAASGATGGAVAAGQSAVTIADTSLGKILAGPSGRTLYAFTNDTNATSTCYSTCAVAWPPLTTAAQWSIAPGLDTGIFSTITRNDGTTQIVVGKWPLYYYAGDKAPGDTSGQGSGGVWYVVGIDGKLVKGSGSSASNPGDGNSDPYPGGNNSDPYPGGGNGNHPSGSTSAPADGGANASVSTAQTNLGQVLVDSNGLTLYGLTKDSDGVPTCVDACATTWPPLLVNGSELPAGLDANVFSLVDSPTGQKQLEAGKWPLYRFSGDQKPGDTNGQGSGGVWFAVDPTGKLIKS